MTRLLIGAAIGVAGCLLGGAALGIRGEQVPTDDQIAAAEEAGVEALDLQGAVNTTSLEPRAYLIAVGELALPIPALPQTVITGWPISGALGQRIFCVRGIEYSHVRFIWKPQGWTPALVHVQRLYPIRSLPRTT